MAGNRSNQINIGGLINPTDGISRSLSQLSNTFGRQAAAEQAAINSDRAEAVTAQNRAQDLTFRNAQESRAQTAFGNKEQQRLGAAEFNRAASTYNPNTAKYTLDSLYPTIAKDITRGRDLISGAQSDFVNFATGDKSDKSLTDTADKYKKYLSSQDLTEADRVDQLAIYKQGLEGTRAELAGLDDKGKQSLIARLSQEKFGGRLDAIDNDISSGRYLVKADKVKSFISQLPRSILDNVPYDTLYKTIANQTGGITAKQIRESEATRVKDVNAGNKLMFGKAMSSVNAKLRKSGKSSSSWKSGDLKNALEGIEGIDIGVFDNKDVQRASKDMLSQGKHPVAVYSAIKQSIDTNLFGSSFFSKEGDPKAYENFTALVDTFATQLGGKSGKGKSSRSKDPVNLSVEVARDLATIRRQGIKFKADDVQLRSLLSPEIVQGLGAYKANKPDVVAATVNQANSGETLGSLNQVPTQVRRPSIPASVGNPDVPEGSTILPAEAVRERLPLPAGNYNPAGNPYGNINQFFRNAATGIRNIPGQISSLGGGDLIDRLTQGDGRSSSRGVWSRTTNDRRAVPDGTKEGIASTLPISVAVAMTPTMKEASSKGSYTDMISFAESSGKSTATNGQYLGKFQMGDMALQDAGYKNSSGGWTGKNGVKSKDDYLENVDAQDDAFKTYSTRNDKALKSKGLTSKVGTVFKGVTITEKGLKAAAHLVGVEGLVKMFETGIVPEDGNGTKALSYLQMGAGQ